jgi:hypothetical protein
MAIAWGSTDIKTLLIHRAAKCWWKARFSDVPFRLSLLLSHYIGDRPRRTEILDGLLLSIVNSLIVCLISFRTSQFGFIPANLVCICVYAFGIRSWLKKANTRTGSPGLSVASRATLRPPRAARHARNRPSSPPPTMATSCFAPDAARLARSFTSGKPILPC